MKQMNILETHMAEKKMEVEKEASSELGETNQKYYMRKVGPGIFMKPVLFTAEQADSKAINQLPTKSLNGLQYKKIASCVIADNNC